MSETIDLTDIADGIPLISFQIGDPRTGGVHLTKAVDNHSPLMFAASTSGKHIAQATVHTPPMTYVLKDCLLTAYGLHDQTEEWTVSYASIELDAADGTTAAGYDRGTGESHEVSYMTAADASEPVSAPEGEIDV